MSAKKKQAPVIDLLKLKGIREILEEEWRKYQDSTDESALQDLRAVLTKFFDDNVVAKLARPVVILSSDLSGLFIREFAISEFRHAESDFDELYDSFVSSVMNEIDDEIVSEPIVVFRHETDNQFELESLAEKDATLWQRKGEFEVYLLNVVSCVATGGFSANEIVYIAISGKCTKDAHKIACEDASDAIAVILQLAKMLSDSASEASINKLLVEFKHLFYEDRSGQHAERPKLAESPMHAKDASSPEEPELPGAVASYYFPMLTELLEAYFGATTLSHKKRGDDVSYRLRNALHLLSHSDRQTADGIGLALSVTAIETLLCDKKEGMSEIFARNVSALIEPDTLQRFNAHQFAKRMYDARSNVLHGTNMEVLPSERQNAQLLAAMVVKAVVDRRLARRARGEKEETLSEMSQSLHRDQLQQLECVDGDDLRQYVADQLWRKRADDKCAH